MAAAPAPAPILAMAVFAAISLLYAMTPSPAPTPAAPASPPAAPTPAAPAPPPAAPISKRGTDKVDRHLGLEASDGASRWAGPTLAGENVTDSPPAALTPAASVSPPAPAISKRETGEVDRHLGLEASDGPNRWATGPPPAPPGPAALAPPLADPISKREINEVDRQLGLEASDGASRWVTWTPEGQEVLKEIMHSEKIWAEFTETNFLEQMPVAPTLAGENVAAPPPAPPTPAAPAPPPAPPSPSSALSPFSTSLCQFMNFRYLISDILAKITVALMFWILEKLIIPYMRTTFERALRIFHPASLTPRTAAPPQATPPPSTLASIAASAALASTSWTATTHLLL